MRKRLLCILMVVVMIMIVACGKKSDGDSSDKGVNGDSNGGENVNNNSDNNDGDSEEDSKPIMSLAQLATSNEYIDGVMLRKKMTFKCIEDLKAKSTFTEDDFNNNNFKIYDRKNMKISTYEQMPTIFAQAKEGYNASSESGSFPIVTIDKSMTLDGAVIVDDDKSKINKKANMLNGILVIPSGVTLTLTNNMVLTLTDMTNSHGGMLIKSGGEVIVEYGEIQCYQGILIEENAKLTINQGCIETANLVNNGTITIAASDAEKRTSLVLDNSVFNGEKGKIVVTNGGNIDMRGSRGGIYSVKYSDDKYGNEECAFYDEYGGEVPFGYNKGLISVSDKGYIYINSTDMGSEAVPFINDGEMIIEAVSDHDYNGRYAGNFSDIHFQNYGVLKIQGENKETKRVLYAFSSLVENYGTIVFDHKSGYGLYLYSQKSSKEDGYTYFINYEGGILEEKNNNLQSIELESYAVFFNKVVPTDKMATINSDVAKMIARETWEGNYVFEEFGEVQKENYVKVGYGSGYKMYFEFNYMNGEDRFSCRTDFLLTSVKDYGLTFTCTSSDYPGNYETTIKLSSDLKNLTYTIEGTKYGTLSSTVPRKEN